MSVKRWRRAVYLSSTAPGKARMLANVLYKANSGILLIVVTLLAFTPLLDDQASASQKIINTDRGKLIFFGVIAYILFEIALVIIDIVRKFSETQPNDIRRSFPRLPILPSTAEFMQASGSSSDKTAGGAIEVFAYPFIDKGIADNGWSVDEVTISGKPGLFPIVPDLRSKQPIAGVNGKKYSLVGFERPHGDTHKVLDLTVQGTDWYTLRRSVNIVQNDVALRHSLSNLDPAKHAIASSLCLHFVCLTSDDYFLALKRLHDTPYFPNAMSISFEEQFAEEDFNLQKSWRMKGWFVRSLCEEVLPLAGLYRNNPLEALAEVENHFSFMNIWTCFFEEVTGNFSLFGVTRLKTPLSGLLPLFDELKLKYNTRHDREGDIFYFSKDQIQALLETGHTTATRLFNGKEEVVKELHPTTLYRIANVYESMS